MLIQFTLKVNVAFMLNLNLNFIRIQLISYQNLELIDVLMLTINTGLYIVLYLSIVVMVRLC